MTPLPPLADWTLETISRLVNEFDHEPGRFDFKAVLKGTGNDAEGMAQRIRSTAASMANSNGGFIIFGVADARVPVTKPDERIIGIPLDRDLRKQFGDLVARIEPEVHFETIPKSIPVPSGGGKGVFVVEIPPSPLRPHTLEGVFYRRGSGGSAEIMNVQEVTEQIVFKEERIRRVTLLRLECQQLLEVVSIIRGTGEHELAYYFGRFDVSALKVLLADVCALLPGGMTVPRLLLQVAVEAKQVNETMDRLYTATINARGDILPKALTWPAIVQSMALQIERGCKAVEDELAKRFGPLVQG